MQSVSHIISQHSTDLANGHSNNQITVHYHDLEEIPIEPIQKGVQYHELHVHHNHPTATKTAELVATAIKAGDFPKAAQIIETVNLCSLRLTCSKGRVGQHEESDINLFHTLATDDRRLHDLLLQTYLNAVLQLPG